MIDGSQIIVAFKQELHHAGLTPRDVADSIGLHSTSLYRILSGRRRTSHHALQALRMATKFLHWGNQRGMLTGSASRDTRERPQRVAEAFEAWLIEP